MIVACEKCNSRFSLEDSVLTEGGSKVQCSNCNHVFTVFPPSAQSADENAALDEILRDLTAEGLEPAPGMEDASAVSKKVDPERGAASSEEETLFDIDTLDLSEISDLPAPDPEAKREKLETFEPDSLQPKESPDDDLEFVLGDDFEIEEKSPAAQSPSDMGKIEFDLSDLEEILKSEREPKPEKKPGEKLEAPLKEEPAEPPIEFDVEILEDTVSETATPEKPPQEAPEAVPLEEADIIDELDLTEFTETEPAPAQEATPEKAARAEAPAKYEQETEAELPLELESRKPPISMESGKEVKPFAEARIEEEPEEAVERFAPEALSRIEGEVPPEAFSLSGKSSRIRPPLLVLLLLALVGGAGYGVYLLSDRVGISIPFLKDILQSETSDPGNLRIRILDVDGHFVVSPRHGKRLVISGRAVNDYAQARSEIQVTGNLLKPGQQISETKTVYCGSLIPETELIKMDIRAIDARLSGTGSSGGSGAMQLQPGQSAHFMIVFENPPPDSEEYSVTVSGSKALP